MEALYLEDHYGKDDFHEMMLTNARDYIAETESYVRPMVTRTYDSSWMMFDHHTYPGGAWRIHQLRRMLGDEAFWTGVKNYISTYSGHVVETDDFRKCLERESGLNLTKYFDQWFYSKGFPKLKGTYTYDPQKRLVQISLEQTQSTGKGKDSSASFSGAAGDIPFFEFSLDVEVTDEGGKVYKTEVVFDGEASGKKAVGFVVLDESQGGVKNKPRMVRVDPDLKWLFTLEMNTGEEVLENTARHAGDIMNRIRAYQELIKIGTASAMKKVRAAVKEEGYHGVRTEVASALSRAKTQASITILAEMLAAEKEPLAMWHVADSCSIRDEEMRTALKKFLERTDLPYTARCKALESLGRQRHPDDIPYLLSVARDDSQQGQHGIIRRGALHALAYTRSAEGFAYLLTRLPRGIEQIERLRPTVVQSLAITTRWQDDAPPSAPRKNLSHVADLLIDLLRDVRNEFVVLRRACITALCDLEATDRFGEIKAQRGTFTERVW
ncbi:hypothetical protein HK102_008803, partial [Quaeritorhiza haematococci]